MKRFQPFFLLTGLVWIQPVVSWAPSSSSSARPSSSSSSSQFRLWGTATPVDEETTTMEAAPATATASPTTTTTSTTTSTTLSPTLLSQTLIDTLTSMTSGDGDELRLVQDCINQLEAVYQPPHTLEFFHFAHEGTWQLLFSTKFVQPQYTQQLRPPWEFRLRQVQQNVRADHQQRTRTHVNTTVVWDWNEPAAATDNTDDNDDNNDDDDDYYYSAMAGPPPLANANPQQFALTGRFTVRSYYDTHPLRGVRLYGHLQQHVLQPLGKALPQNVPNLVGILFRALAPPHFDPTGYAADVTYLDDRLRIVRYTNADNDDDDDENDNDPNKHDDDKTDGDERALPSLEGVRDIWIRVNPDQDSPKTAATAAAASQGKDHGEEDDEGGLF